MRSSKKCGPNFSMSHISFPPVMTATSHLTMFVSCAQTVIVLPIDFPRISGWNSYAQYLSNVKRTNEPDQISRANADGPAEAVGRGVGWRGPRTDRHPLREDRNRSGGG